MVSRRRAHRLHITNRMATHDYLPGQCSRRNPRARRPCNEQRWRAKLVARQGNGYYFHSDRSGSFAGLEVQKPMAAEAVQITRNGGGTALESTDGKFLYYSKATSPADLRCGERRLMEEKRLRSLEGVSECEHFCPHQPRHLFHPKKRTDCRGFHSIFELSQQKDKHSRHHSPARVCRAHCPSGWRLDSIHPDRQRRQRSHAA